jgi:hypothetical protein
MADSINRKCYTSQEIVSNNGQVINDSNGVVSVYLPNNIGVLAPFQLTSECCKVLGSEYTFDIDTQKCRWAPASDDICGVKDPFKLVLNPKGNDGTIFYVDENQTCELSIDFDYLFKIKCETLANILKPVVQNQIDPRTFEVIKNLENNLQNMIKDCSSYDSQIIWYQTEIANTPYSIYCDSTTATAITPIKTVSVKNNPELIQGFKQSGFASKTSSSPLAPFSFGLSDYYNIPLCLTEPDGLAAWATILGPVNYQAFLAGDPSSYTCDEVTTFINQNISNSLLIPAGPILFNTCNIPFGTKTNLMSSLNEILIKQQGCSETIKVLQAELTTLTQSIETETNSACKTPIEFFETFNVSATLDLVSGGTIQTVATFPLFNTIGTGQLYNYLVAHPENSGFYVCGDNDIDSSCTPMTLDAADINDINTFICDDVMNNLLTSLYAESGLSGTTNGQDSFNTALPFNGLASKWLHFHTVVNDPVIIDLIANQKIKISFEINHACGDFCVLVDEIVLDKNCSQVSYSNIFLTQSPGFELDRIRDNKKSWIANTTLENRQFSISNNLGNQSIRQTNYDVNDERLVINTKEIDLDINLAGAIETDIWCYLNDNPCILTGITTCSPCCGNKTFQDDECFAFMDDYTYDFMDGTSTGVTITSLFNHSNCCGDDMIDFASLMTQPISAVTTIEDFEYFLNSELIDAKNRQTISGYPTLRALYNRYMSSYLYCGNNSSKFDYLTMDQFSSLVGNYWVDIVEQVVPATTIWGSVKIYSNTIFDQQKYKYKSYSTLFCDNQFSGIPVLSPINGVNGKCANVEVITTPLNLKSNTDVNLKKAITTCNNICIAQMNSGSEFIGSVQVIGFELDGGNSVGIGDGNNSYTIIETIK